MRVVSVNVAAVRAISVKGRNVATGIFKEPVDGPRRVDAAGFQGDSIVEVRKAGIEHHAVYAYPVEHYAYWEGILGRSAFPWGQFGENLTVEGMSERDVRIGDIFRCGGACLQVTMPRIPCAKLSAKMGDRFAGRFLESRRTGFYLRVIEPGDIQSGDLMECVDSDPSSATVDAFLRDTEIEYWEETALERALRARGLPVFVRDAIVGKIERARTSQGWVGWRELIVSRRTAESDDVMSLELCCARQRPLPTFRGGQHLMLGIRTSDDGTARRAYAISSDPSDLSHYRITVMLRPGAADRETGRADTTVSAHLHQNIEIGSAVKACAPSGSFTLSSAAGDTSELVLVSEGVGVAPLCSMVLEWAHRSTPTPVHVLHGYPSAEAFPLARDLVALQRRGLPLSLRGAPPGASRDPALRADQALGTVRDKTTVFIAGESRFVDDVVAILTTRGIPPARIHAERFGAVGVIARPSD